MSLDDDLRRMDDEEDMIFDLDSADDLDMGESDVLMDTVDELPLEVDFDDFNEDEIRCCRRRGWGTQRIGCRAA